MSVPRDIELWKLFSVHKYKYIDTYRYKHPAELRKNPKHRGKSKEIIHIKESEVDIPYMDAVHPVGKESDVDMPYMDAD